MSDMSGISTLILNNQNKQIKNILTRISKDYNLDLNEICNKYLNTSNTSLTGKVNNLQLHERCQAIKQDGEQCSRRHQTNIKFCGKHTKKKYGEVLNNSDIKEEDFLSVQKIYINKKEYLIDSCENAQLNGTAVLYANNVTNPKVLGTCQKIYPNPLNKDNYEHVITEYSDI